MCNMKAIQKKAVTCLAHQREPHGEHFENDKTADKTPSQTREIYLIVTNFRPTRFFSQH